MPGTAVGWDANGGPFAATTLKAVQELCALTAFGVFSATVLKERPLWTDALGFALIAGGVALALVA